MDDELNDFVATADGVRFGPNGEWTAHMAWRDGDHNGPSRLIVEPTSPDNYPAGGISQTVLRGIKFGGVIDAIRKGREAIAESAGDEPAPPIDWEATGTRLIELSENGISEPYLAALSWAYSAAANQPKPLERLANVTGKSPSAIKSHLWHATRAGLLYRSPGRAGGAVTERALRILDGA